MAKVDQVLSENSNEALGFSNLGNLSTKEVITLAEMTGGQFDIDSTVPLGFHKKSKSIVYGVLVEGDNDDWIVDELFFQLSKDGLIHDFGGTGAEFPDKKSGLAALKKLSRYS